MIYRTFETIPYKLFVKINETANYKLLTDEDGHTDQELQDIWTQIHEEYSQRSANDQEDKIMRIEREIDYFELKYKIIQIGCEILKFDYSQEVADAFADCGYYIDETNFLDKIEQIARESEGLLIKADSYRDSLPVVPEGERATVDDILASYCVILNIDFDFNTVPASKVLSLGKQIDKKIKSLTEK